ncbi:hypothetical protein ZOSMA_174G00180 [Zostera marina]|uniref:Uncharacterized protein n=1 Tax=Zostera marina TaxID=29655 RepID=A0A0K9PU94_ZOSMR|nr:hypothetical protein ZOSMA_174G00180 [Zostera marina]
MRIERPGSGSTRISDLLSNNSVSSTFAGPIASKSFLSYALVVVGSRVGCQIKPG